MRDPAPLPGQAPYYNCGSCVHPRCITGIEVEAGQLTLVKWEVEPEPSVVSEEGTLRIKRTALAGGPVPLGAALRAGK